MRLRRKENQRICGRIGDNRERTFDQCMEGRQRIGHFAAQVALGFLSHLNRGNAVQNGEFAQPENKAASAGRGRLRCAPATSTSASIRSLGI